MNENAIDRNLVCAFIDGLISDDGERKKGLEYIRNMPPVNPTKTGHWVFVDKAHEHAHCSECDYGNVDLLDGRPHNYCPNCSAKMESEDKTDAT